ncbi:MAG TPA: CDP-diacylglycerol--serine O-phosphatidyltransferase [Gemmatimonadaceae bacterium]|nr:CDP-diacylglycerol--serine O-phosphatidyltransferase [Gemmatimonadaceae bacterium]
MTDSRAPVRRVVVALPNGLTLLNLFFGVFAIVTAARGDYGRAALYIVIGGIADAFDGRIARATRTGTRFGEELDSLVDAISFGLAPAFLMYFASLRTEGWDWVFVFLFAACAVIRLARFNVEQAGRPKQHFVGLPSPMAGGTLATYYWFSQTPLYNQTFLAELPWQILLKYLMAALAFLMISNVPYPTWPTFSLRTWRGALGLAGFLGLIVGLVALPREFFFPLGVAYVSYGVLRAALLGLVERVDEDVEPAIVENGDVVHLDPSRSARRAHGRPTRPHRPPGPDTTLE